MYSQNTRDLEPLIQESCEFKVTLSYVEFEASLDYRRLVLKQQQIVMAVDLKAANTVETDLWSDSLSCEVFYLFASS